MWGLVTRAIPVCPRRPWVSLGCGWVCGHESIQELMAHSKKPEKDSSKQRMSMDFPDRPDERREPKTQSSDQTKRCQEHEPGQGPLGRTRRSTAGKRKVDAGKSYRRQVV